MGGMCPSDTVAERRLAVMSPLLRLEPDTPTCSASFSACVRFLRKMRCASAAPTLSTSLRNSTRAWQLLTSKDSTLMAFGLIVTHRTMSVTSCALLSGPVWNVCSTVVGSASSSVRNTLGGARDTSMTFRLLVKSCARWSLSWQAEITLSTNPLRRGSSITPATQKGSLLAHTTASELPSWLFLTSLTTLKKGLASPAPSPVSAATRAPRAAGTVLRRSFIV
mmetsp:Transcript_41915/g.102282  ORF Transcript_41915/g.102282 Transcript_41915/m.102282 type:complete len:222 (-) Transcript_41915:314-979(-)